VRKTAPVRKAATRSRPRPQLIVIASERQVVARGPFLALVGLMMLAGLLSLLMLHTLAAQDAFRQTSLQQRLAALTDTQQQLEQQVQRDSAPDALQARAKALGMVPSTVTSYHLRADGRTVAHQVALTEASATTTSTSDASSTTQDKSSTTQDKSSAASSPGDAAGKPANDKASDSPKHRRKASSE
jgi:cell division protein FtsB